MATYKTTSFLQLTLSFASGNNQILLLPNPDENVSASDINSVSSFIASNQLILGDNSATFVEISDAKIVNKTTLNEKFTLTA